MIKLFLYFIVLLSFIPLVSSGKVRPRTHRHISKEGNITGNSFLARNDADDSMKVILTPRPPQDSLKNANRKRIKEVARAKPQSKPEKVGQRGPVDRPSDPDPGNAAHPVARPAIRSGDGQGGGARPAIRSGEGAGGARRQAPPARPGR